ncbi:MAG: hypothetical protein CVT69_00300 [Actinobacteria bacterium HGW-Actinobacteria-9]|jgi:uncharacterized protein|nr:MAG: hypothetical protein CVT69_00300 [Actinobacteria bacterium HGW-Actinobacteria-9]
MKPYPVDVSEIAHDLGASVVIDDRIDVGDLTVGETVFAAAGPAKVDVTVTNGGDGIVAYGTIEAHFVTECSRCLEPFTLEVVGDVEGFYTTPEKAEELPEDQEWEPLADTIDLAHAFDAALRINMPFAPLHDPDCAGICPVCGTDLNVTACDCAPPEERESPFAALKDLLESDRESDL